MNSISYDLYRVVDPKKKDAEWANACIGILRRDWRQLVTTDRMRANKQVIFGQQSMEKIQAMFKDKEFIKTTVFEPIDVITRIINILVNEIENNPPKVELKANDATALSDKKEDITRLRLKGQHEKTISEINSTIGLPPKKVGFDKFKSNVDEFERLGLNPYDPEDIDFYEQSGYQRLKYEIAGQKLVNAIMKSNRFDEETIRDFVLDILASLTCCMQVAVDNITGEINYRRIYPEEAYGIWGDKRDGSDDIAKGYMTNMTIRDWLGRVGNQFEFDRDWVQLLWAINYANQTKYTGFIRGGRNFDIGDLPNKVGLMGQVGYAANTPVNRLDYNLAWTYKIYAGYIEWSSMDATATYLAKKGTDELIPKQVDFDVFLENQKENEGYYKESFYQEQIYKSYFLSTSSVSQWIYNWGKVYYQRLHGAFDQYSRGTLWYYRMEGTPAAEIVKPYIDLVNLSFYRLKWMVYHAKPRKEQYIIPELIKVAKSMQRLYPQNAQSKAPTVDNLLTQLIQWKQENFIDLRDFPEVDGKPFAQIMPQNTPERGADPTALWMQAIYTWCESQIAEKIGLNDVRLGQIQNMRQGYKQGEQETKASLNSTGYIYRIIQYQKEHIAITTLSYSQDIVRFKDTIPYNYLKKMMGADEFENLKLLGDFAAHRYAVFVENYNAVMEKQKIMQAADMSLDKDDGKGGITLWEWGIVMSEEDPKKALKLLALAKHKAEKRKKAWEMQMLQQQHKNAMELQKAEAATEKMKQDGMLGKAKMETEASKYVANRNYDAKVDTKNMMQQHEPEKQNMRAENQKDLIQEKADAKEQEAFGA